MTTRKATVFCALAGALILAGCRLAGGPAAGDGGAEPLKVLMIGNSFSICVLNHLPAIAEAEGCALDLASLYIGGCPLSRHWRNVEAARTNETAGLYRYDRAGAVRVHDARIQIPAALATAKWDVVTLQQASHESWRAETFQPWADELAAVVRELAPTARIMLQQTWSYNRRDPRIACDPHDRTKGGEWGLTQDGMYAAARSNYWALATAKGYPVIPVGDAVQAYRESTGFGVEADCVGSALRYGPKGARKTDTIHLNRDGDYLQALVWFGFLFDRDPRGVRYVPEGMSTVQAARLQRAAARALGRVDAPESPASAIYPAGDCTVELNPVNQLILASTTNFEQRIAMLQADRDAGGPRFGGDHLWRRPERLFFRWEGPSECGRHWRVEIAEDPDFARILSVEDVPAWSDLLREEPASTPGRTVWTYRRLRPNLEFGRTYYWRAKSNIRCPFVRSHGRSCACENRPIDCEMPVASFRTGRKGVRWIELEGAPGHKTGNVRDLGGKTGADGRRFRQGLIFRGERLNEDSGSGDTGDTPGRTRLSLEDYRYLLDTLGIRTDLDMRSERETGLMKGSPLGDSVAWVHSSSSAYGGIFSPEGKAAMAKNFRLFARRENYPIYFHCSGGADRAGSLAFTLLSVAGVPCDKAEQDWEHTFYPYQFKEIRGMSNEAWRRLDAVKAGFDAYGSPDDPYLRKVELYLLDCGVTMDEIRAYRDIVLEDAAPAGR